MRGFLAAAALYSLAAGLFTVAYPLYARGAGLGPEAIGAVVAAQWATLLALGIPLGIVADGRRSRPLLVVGFVVAGLGAAGLALWPGGPAAIAAALCFGAGGLVFWVLGDPFLAAHSVPADRLHLFGMKFFLVVSGGAAGSLLAGAIPEALSLLARGPGGGGGAPGASALDPSVLRWAILAMAPALGGAALAAAGRAGGPRPNPPPLGTAPEGAAPPGGAVLAPVVAAAGSWGWRRELARIAVLVAPEGFVALMVGGLNPFLALFWHDRFGLEPGAIGALAAASGLVGSVGALVGAAVARRTDPVRTVAGSRLAAAGFLGLQIFAGWAPAAVTAQFARLFLQNQADPAFIGFAMARVPQRRRATFSSLYSVTWSVGLVAGPVVTGRLLPHAGYGGAFLVPLAALVAAAVWPAVAFRRLEPAEPEPGGGPLPEAEPVAVEGPGAPAG